jgi:Tol biopolymer transport system component
MSISILSAFLLFPVVAQQSIDRVSLGANNSEANNQSLTGSLSADGRFLVFGSLASNLVPGDNNHTQDIFVRDLETGEVSCASVNSQGDFADGTNMNPAISASGRYVVFSSWADNLDPNDVDGDADIYLHDRWTSETTLVSASIHGTSADEMCSYPSISADGQIISFSTNATNLTTGSGNGSHQIFVLDRNSGQMQVVSRNAMGQLGNRTSLHSQVSPCGQLVAIVSGATNLIPGDTNQNSDVFVVDRQALSVLRVSVDSNGLEANGNSFGIPAWSGDSRFVAFESGADNLVIGDSNWSLDIFLYEFASAQVERVSLTNWGGQANSSCQNPKLSNDGRLVVFQSKANNLVSHDSGAIVDIFARDRKTGRTVCLTNQQAGITATENCFNPSISADGQFVTFGSDAGDFVVGDTNGEHDIFRRDLGVASNVNTILLVGPSLASIGDNLNYSWYAAPAHAPYWFAASQTDSGTTLLGHAFDLGRPFSMVATGVCTDFGAGQATLTVPPTVAGMTVFLEVAAFSAGKWSDSNLRTLVIQ